MSKKKKIMASPKIIKQRGYIYRQFKIKLLKVFDTNEYEPDKDVSLGQWQGKKVVVRVGECRLKNFPPNGYRGKYFIIPKLYLWNKKDNYEIEEYLPGKLFSDLLPKPKPDHLIVSHQWLEILIKAHWEFQSIAKKIKLPNKIDKQNKIIKFYSFAKKLILPKNRKKVQEIILDEKYKFFWDRLFPSKWKFSPDNLLALNNHKVGFIDLAGVGKRHWGYDLGWLFWPQWFNFSSTDYRRVTEHFSYLSNFFKLVFKFAPVSEKVNQKLFYRKCHLVLFERIIGALYDLAAEISHTRKMTKQRKGQLIIFLRGLLKLTLERIN